MSFVKKTLFAAAALACTFALKPATAEELKMGLITPPAHVWTKAANRFADELAKQSGGSLTVAVFPAGQLGAEPEMFQQLQAGLLDMGLMTGALTSLREPSMVGWFTPFLFKDVQAAAAAAKTPAAQQMLANLDKIGLKGLGYTFAGMRHILMRDAPAKTIADLKGKKVRIVPFPAMKIWWETAGAVPTPVQLPDVYQALQNGLLDGVDIDLDALVGSKFQDVAKGLTLTAHMPFPAVAVIGKGRWASLKPDQQALITKVLGETLAWADQEAIAAEGRNFMTLEKAITVVRLDNAKDAFAAANAAFDKAFGADPLIKAFQEQAAAAQK